MIGKRSSSTVTAWAQWSGVSPQHDLAAAIPVIEDVAAGPDRVLEERPRPLRLEDRPRVDRAGDVQAVEQHPVRKRGPDLHAEVVHLDALRDHRQDPLAVRRAVGRVALRSHGRDHVVRGEVVAVVKAHPLAQVELHRQRVEAPPRDRQRRLHHAPSQSM
jgi:hypothetical protein